MPKFTVTNPIKKDSTFYPRGSEIELTLDEAKDLEHAITTRVAKPSAEPQPVKPPAKKEKIEDIKLKG